VTSNLAVAAAISVIQDVAPFDQLEAEHQQLALAWMTSTDDIFRRVKPTTPTPHLVSYVVLLDRPRQRVLLGEHRLAGLWLPVGGHVEPGEHPAAAARREAREELGIDVEPFAGDTTPSFVTWTRTRSADPHIDVSLWFLMTGDATRQLHWDQREFLSTRWWSGDDLRAVPAQRFDPAMGRFLAKLQHLGLWGRPASESGSASD
jgi:8-oxo-dGTP diphosphatase